MKSHTRLLPLFISATIVSIMLSACQPAQSLAQPRNEPEPKVYAPVLGTTQTGFPIMPTPLPNQSGPWQQDLDVVFSDDGANTFGDAKVLVPRAGVPSLIRDLQGRLLLAFQWFPENSPNFDQVAVMISTDNGQTWGAPQPISMSNFPSTMQRPFDPTIVQLPDGRYRLYYSSSNRGASGASTKPATYSAVSTDGIHYEFEAGARFEGSGQVIDPAVVLFNGVWHFTTPVGTPQEGAYHAISSNGIYFARHSNIASVNNANWTGNLLAYDDGMRFYGSGPTVWWSFSKDGEVWSTPIFMAVRGGDPAVASLGSKRYVMVYVTPKRR